MANWWLAYQKANKLPKWALMVVAAYQWGVWGVVLFVGMGYLPHKKGGTPQKQEKKGETVDKETEPCMINSQIKRVSCRMQESC